MLNLIIWSNKRAIYFHKPALKGQFTQKWKLCNLLLTRNSKPVRPSFIFGTQIKIFLMKSESFLTLHRQQGYYMGKAQKCSKDIGKTVDLTVDSGWTTDVTWTVLLMSLLCLCALTICRVRKLSDFLKNILMCVLKMNHGLTGFERHEGD